MITSSWATSFVIPYDKFPHSLQEACGNGTRPEEDDRRRMVQIIVDDVAVLTNSPKRPEVEIIVGKLVKKYPGSFKDKAGDGVSTLVNQLMDRIYNRRRKRRSQPENQDENQNETTVDPINEAAPQTTVEIDAYG